jgi:hypothetical protein
LIASEYERGNIKSGLSTGQGLIHHVRDGETPVFSDDMEPLKVSLDLGVDDKRLLLCEDELSVPLKQMQGRENTLSPVLRLAWDGKSLQTMTRAKSLRATTPHISMIAQITPEELRALVNKTDFENGLLNRFLWIHVERTQLLPRGDDAGLPPSASLAVARLADAATWAEGVGVVSLAPDAQTWLERYYVDLSTGAPGKLGQLTRRAAPYVRRLAMLFALSERRAEIAARDLDAAFAVWQYGIESARIIFGAAPFSPLAQRLAAAIEAAGATGLSTTQLRQHGAGTNSSAPGKFAAALDELRRAGVAFVVQERGNGRGRPAIIWRHVRHRQYVDSVELPAAS